eukprot:s2761_g7.t1
MFAQRRSSSRECHHDKHPRRRFSKLRTSSSKIISIHPGNHSHDSHFVHGFQGFLSTAMILQRRNIKQIGSKMAIRPGGRPPTRSASRTKTDCDYDAASTQV